MGSVDKKMVMDLIRRQPGVRSVEIADELDMDVEQVHRLLVDEIGAGTIVVKQLTAPGGKALNSYHFSPQAQSATAPVALAALAIGTASATPVTVSASAEKQAPETAWERRASPKMRTELAIDYLRTCGAAGARSQELAAAMGLRADQSPSNFLRTARERGQVIAADGRWRIVESAVAHSPAKAPAIPEPGAAAFRCAIWSDGFVELQRGGQRIAVLTSDECRQLQVLFERRAA